MAAAFMELQEGLQELQAMKWAARAADSAAVLAVHQRYHIGRPPPPLSPFASCLLQGSLN
jgi:hypothetical protein